MTTLDELERAVKRVENEVSTCWRRRGGAPVVTLADLRILLSERAELLATVERMREELETFAQAKPTSANGFVNISGRNVYVFAACSALTTGEEK